MLTNTLFHLLTLSSLLPYFGFMTAVLSFNLLGDAWRDWLDPRTRSQMAAQVFPLSCSWCVKTQTRDRTMGAHYLVRITGAPRPRLKARAALALFTAISRYPLEPT